MSGNRYINRELSWLEFNARVLEEATCSTNPLLERLKFLAITASNLDEFFRVRVGGLKLVAQSGRVQVDITGLTAVEQLEQIRERVQQLNSDQSDCFHELERLLAKEGIRRLAPSELDSAQRDYLARFVSEDLVSVVTPVAVERPEDFPNLSGSRLCVCLRVSVNPEASLLAPSGADPGQDERFVIVPLGKSLPRIISLPSEEGFAYMFVESVIGLHLEQLIGHHTVLEQAVFRLTRNADLALNEDGVADLLLGMQQLLAERTFGSCVRLELADSASPQLERFLRQALEISSEDLYLQSGPIDFAALFPLTETPGFGHLRDPDRSPVASPDFPRDGTSVFETIASKDRLLSHPYQSYDPVVQLLREAAQDPDVIAIKQTLYRTARNSQIVQALLEAAENGKNVTAIVELKARFDEARNIQWARQLEHAGVDVIYGVSGLKTHAKICLVIRREPIGIHRYMHFSTGNYNESTAKLYGDISFFSDDEQLGQDAVHFFNAITGLSIPQPLSKLAAAPINLREKLIELIRVEMENARSGQQARIMAKLNSLVDREVIDALYEASEAGVRIQLNVRGICCLRAGVKGLSENIQVISIIDRFLEHARIFYFHHGGSERIFLSSADWMNRNLDKRVELMVPVDEPSCRFRLKRILELCFDDNTKCRMLMPDNSYAHLTPPSAELAVRYQDVLYQEAKDLLQTSTNPRTTVFKPHRGEVR